MSTRSNIGIENPDGSVRGIYCHYDGYPSHHGKILLAHYTDRAKVEALIALGDLSVLDEEIGEKHDFDARPRPAGWCLAYGRDRGEEDTGARRYPSPAAFRRDMEEYAYLFTAEGTWLYSDHGGDFAPLTAEACAEAA